MGKLFWQISTTVDGFMSGPDGELERTAGFTDADFERYASEMLRSISGIVIGRKTYELFVDYWPAADGEDADNINGLPKLVVSTTLEKVEWNNATLVKGDVPETVRDFASRSEKDVAVFGSSELASSMIRDRIIDEFRILVTPFVLGRGRRAFVNDLAPHQLILKKAEAWASGTVAQFYEPIYK